MCNPGALGINWGLGIRIGVLGLWSLQFKLRQPEIRNTLCLGSQRRSVLGRGLVVLSDIAPNHVTARTPETISSTPPSHTSSTTLNPKP